MGFNSGFKVLNWCLMKLILITCYTIQLMHHSHSKTHSLQHSKPIKCQKRVCKYKTPTCFGLFSWTSSGGPQLCFVPLLFLPLICVRWVYIIKQYVAACVCHLCVFGVLVCWWSACELSSSVCVWCSCLLVICLWIIVICVCLVFLSVGDLLVNNSQADHQQTRTPNTHRRRQFTSRSPTEKNTKHTQMTYTCSHILLNNTNSTNANQREE